MVQAIRRRMWTQAPRSHSRRHQGPRMEQERTGILGRMGELEQKRQWEYVQAQQSAKTLRSDQRVPVCWVDSNPARAMENPTSSMRPRSASRPPTQPHTPCDSPARWMQQSASTGGTASEESQEIEASQATSELHVEWMANNCPTAPLDWAPLSDRRFSSARQVRIGGRLRLGSRGRFQKPPSPSDDNSSARMPFLERR